MKKLILISAIILFAANSFAQHIHNYNKHYKRNHFKHEDMCKPNYGYHQSMVYTAPNYYPSASFRIAPCPPFVVQCNRHTCIGHHQCIQPMSVQEFEGVKQAVACQNFDDTRLLTAKQIVNSNRLQCWQICELMQVMHFEESRLELAKHAWHHSIDPQNYYQVNDGFSFRSSVAELLNYTSYN